LARRIEQLHVDAVCGPLVEGAFVALMVAEELEVKFLYTERIENASDRRLFPVDYRLPATLRELARNRRVAIVNDVINAGSAVRGTAADLKACGAELIGIAALATLGGSAAKFAGEQGVPLIALTNIESSIWTPDDCPFCRAGVPLVG
jgi:orotate phosphoribosyltransferase